MIYLHVCLDDLLKKNLLIAKVRCDSLFYTKHRLWLKLYLCDNSCVSKNIIEWGEPETVPLKSEVLFFPLHYIAFAFSNFKLKFPY